MNIRDKINNGDYTPKTPLNSKPQEPGLSLSKGLSPAQQRELMDEHLLALKVYEKDLEVWKEERHAYRAEQARLRNLFRTDLLQELGISEHPKRDLLFSLAWNMGHGNGESEVLNIAEVLTDLIRP